MRFADIPGHEDIKSRLRDMVDGNHIPHALLLEGPSGTGKFSLARALASYIHCTNRINGDSCGVCESCLQHSSFNHIDTFYSFPVVKKNDYATSDDYVVDFREFITKYPYMDFSHWQSKLGNVNARPKIYVEEAATLLDRLNHTARRSKYKIVLMWLPERMQPEAANKLLKVIEEPYADTLFILASNNAAEILPTIYSRTQRIKVRRYSDDEVAAYIEKKLKLDSTEAAAIAALSEGNINNAISAVKNAKTHAKQLDLFMRLMRLAWKRQIRDLRAWSLEVAGLGREAFINFLNYCSRMARDNFMLNIGDNRLVAMTTDEMAFSARFSPFINERNVEAIIAEFDQAANDISMNGNAKMIAFDLAVKMVILLRK